VRATTRGGALLDCAPTGNCVYVNWRAPIRGAYHQGDATGGDWVGSLIPGMQDASGLLYKRNRYYSPETGQFTQADPIGIAGGLNTYGFAEGDPVSYDDPYGLCPIPPTNCVDVAFFAVSAGQFLANPGLRTAGAALLDGIRRGGVQAPL
jgi:RHS repeat-associated protein